MNKLYQERPRKGGGTECRIATAFHWKCPACGSAITDDAYENDPCVECSNCRKAKLEPVSEWRRLLPCAMTAPNAQKVHAGQKTQTRRLLNPQPDIRFRGDGIPFTMGWDAEENQHWRKDIAPRHRVGDVLWVQEPWRTHCHYDDFKPTNLPDGCGIKYGDAPADFAPVGKGRPGRFLPLRFARLARYEVTSVRLERVNTISDDDCAAEGCCDRTPLQDNEPAGKFIGERHGLSAVRLRFECLWDSIHAEPGTRFDDAPWVFAYTFTRIR